MKRILFVFILLQEIIVPANSQYTTLNAHSHNDYENVVPFRLAYDNHFGSIEADIWAVNGNLFVAHSRPEIKPERTLDSLYINPIVKLLRQNDGKAWDDMASTFQLLIDIKTSVEPALTLLAEKLAKFPEVFNPSINPYAVRIVITGNRPEPDGFKDYPDFISFDGLLTKHYNMEELARIPLYSENLKKFTNWNGEGAFAGKGKVRLQSVIDSVHSLNKKIRFWNAPDDVNAWQTFMVMGIDYINTDHIVKLAEFLGKK